MESQPWTFCKAGMLCLGKHPQQQSHGCPGKKTAFFLSNEWEDGKMPGCCYYISQSPSEILRHRQACQLQDHTAAG